MEYLSPLEKMMKKGIMSNSLGLREGLMKLLEIGLECDCFKKAEHWRRR